MDMKQKVNTDTCWGHGRTAKRIHKVNYLVTPANMNGTTTSPCKAKIQRIGLLNITYILKVWKHVKILVALILLNRNKYISESGLYQCVLLLKWARYKNHSCVLTDNFRKSWFITWCLSFVVLWHLCRANCEHKHT